MTANTSSAVMQQRQIGPITLICGDMRAVLPMLAQPADMIMTDPPYRLSTGGNSTGEMGGIFAKSRYDNGGELFPIVEWDVMAPLFWAAAADNCEMICMATDHQSHAARGAMQGAGWRFHRLLIWDKGTVTPNRYFMPQTELGLYMWKGHARTINDPSASQIIKAPVRKETDHPTEKPVSVLTEWIRQCTDAGALVLDPFMGTGATMVAAAKLGRRGIGVEINPKYFATACARVETAVNAKQGVMV